MQQADPYNANPDLSIIYFYFGSVNILWWKEPSWKPLVNSQRICPYIPQSCTKRAKQKESQRRKKKNKNKKIIIKPVLGQSQKNPQSFRKGLKNVHHQLNSSRLLFDNLWGGLKRISVVRTSLESQSCVDNNLKRSASLKRIAKCRSENAEIEGFFRNWVFRPGECLLRSALLLKTCWRMVKEAHRREAKQGLRRNERKWKSKRRCKRPNCKTSPNEISANQCNG